MLCSQIWPGPVSVARNRPSPPNRMFLKPLHHLNVEADAGLEHADVAGVDEQPLAGREIALDEFAGEIEPDDAGPGDLLQNEAVAAEEAGAQPLLPGEFERHRFLRDQEASPCGRSAIGRAAAAPARSCRESAARRRHGRGPCAVKSVMKNEPPPNERFSPAKKPPPVWVFIATASFIQAIVLVWL